MSPYSHLHRRLGGGHAQDDRGELAPRAPVQAHVRRGARQRQHGGHLQRTHRGAAPLARGVSVGARPVGLLSRVSSFSLALFRSHSALLSSFSNSEFSSLSLFMSLYHSTSNFCTPHSRLLYVPHACLMPLPILSFLVARSLVI